MVAWWWLWIAAICGIIVGCAWSSRSHYPDPLDDLDSNTDLFDFSPEEQHGKEANEISYRPSHEE